MAYFGKRIRSRLHPELEQASIRFAFGVLVGAFFIFGFDLNHSSSDDSDLSLYGFLAFFFVCSAVLVFSNMLRPQESRARRFFSIALDMGSISYCLYVGGAQAAFVFSLYLWVLVGNGLRFGKGYLWVAMALALLGFSAVVLASNYWRQNISLVVGVYFLIVALPLYFSKLLVRLQDVNHELEKRVEQRTEELAVEKNNALASSRAKGLFLANMSHELRTPLNAIIGYSEMLIEDCKTQHKDDLADDLARINSSGQHLLSMIGDILDLSRIEEGKIVLQPQRIQLQYFIDEIVKSLSSMLVKSGNDISVDPIPEALEIESDKTRLRQILLNILGNAIKFTHRGLIHIGMDLSRSGWVSIHVRDTGIGIDDKHLDSIFESFTQVDQSPSRNYGGSGLGLAICKHFSKLLGGDIKVSSIVNQGSTFSIFLPLKWTIDNSLEINTSRSESQWTQAGISSFPASSRKQF